MAAAQFQDTTNNINVVKRFPAPKKATIKAWYAAARKVIPQMPKQSDGWTITCQSLSTTGIVFDMVNSQGVRTYLVIDRTAPSM